MLKTLKVKKPVTVWVTSTPVIVARGEAFGENLGIAREEAFGENLGSNFA